MCEQRFFFFLRTPPMSKGVRAGRSDIPAGCTVCVRTCCVFLLLLLLLFFLFFFFLQKKTKKIIAKRVELDGGDVLTEGEAVRGVFVLMKTCQ